MTSQLQADQVAALSAMFTRKWMVDVRSDFGAVGDGRTDDTAAIQAAIDACAASGGGMVFFPPGDYRVSSVTLRDSVILWGGRLHFGYLPAGKSTARLRGNAPGAVVVDTPTSGIGNCGVIGLDISGNTSAATCLRFQNVSWGIVKGVALDACQSTALSVGSSGAGFASVVEDVLVTNAVLNRAPTTLTGAVYVGSTDNYFTRVEVSTSEAGLSAGGNVVAWQVTGWNNFFTSCVGEMSDLGWHCGGNANRYIGCRGDSNWGGDWHVVGGVSDFTACKGMNSGRAAPNTYDAWLVDGSANTFTSCSFYQPGSGTYRYGFNDTVNNSSVAARSSWAGCNGGGYGTAMWSTRGFLGSAPIIPNHPIRPGSGSTIDVTGTGLIVPVHSTPTTITDFTGGAEGQEVKVIGNANLTLLNGAAIRTSTGANKTLSANVFYHFIRYNGAWYEKA